MPWTNYYAPSRVLLATCGLDRCMFDPRNQLVFDTPPLIHACRLSLSLSIPSRSTTKSGPSGERADQRRPAQQSPRFWPAEFGIYAQQPWLSGRCPITQYCVITSVPTQHQCRQGEFATSARVRLRLGTNTSNLNCLEHFGVSPASIARR